MSTWTERMHRSALTLSDVVASCAQPSISTVHSRRIEKVKFGQSLGEVCKNDIPGPLLILILRINKEGPNKKDIFRAPGNQGNMKKLTYFLQMGRLINIDNFSVYTIASVLKKFLQMIPNGIFGKENEQELFTLFESDDAEFQREQIRHLVVTMPTANQHLLVLLLGTFRVIAMSSRRAMTGMTSEALGVSVAPSFFQLCVADGRNACMEDVFRFKMATKIMQFLIDNFGVSDMLGRENYEYYARITGRILKVEDDWIFAFRYPPDCFSPSIPLFEETQSTPALVHVPEFFINSVLKAEEDFKENREDLDGIEAIDYSEVEFQHGLEDDQCQTLSLSLESNGLYKVHEKQRQRMESRSQWFLSSWHQPSSSIQADQFSCSLHPIFLIHSSKSFDEDEMREKT